jgi:hypothetical protein
MLTRRALLALPIVAFSPRIAVASEAPTGFRNLKWGAGVPAGLRRLTGPTSEGLSIYAPQSGQKLQPFLDLPVAEESYSFKNGRFYSGSVWLDGLAAFEKIRATFTTAYGKPTFSNPKLELYKWKWPAGRIEISLTYQANFARTTVTFRNDAV